MSEHEGFCVPLLEAMAADVPVLAYASTAVPDTLGGAGVQFFPKDLEYAAELLGALAFDDDLRNRVIAGQRRRLQDFGDDRIRMELQSLITTLSTLSRDDGPPRAGARHEHPAS
jgi:glycosyltransferase involved in cell wall biosynthesis